MVPLDVSVPIDANHSGPLTMICGMLANVSTLLMIVGCPNRPLFAGNGGLFFGSPRLPSMEVISAVSSPHTNAPAPRRMSMSKSNPLSKMFSPSRPYSRAWPMAISSRLTAMGYSART